MDIARGNIQFKMTFANPYPICFQGMQFNKKFKKKSNTLW